MIRAAPARIIQFPPRAIWILRDEGAWLVVAGGSGWLHGGRREALQDAFWLAQNLGLPVRES